jgi:hypothetical protein
VPAWALPTPVIKSEPAQGEAPFRIVYQDIQERLADGADETFNSYRIKILRPEALSLGNISLAWMPSAGPATVHFVRIIRDGKVIDVLAQQKFKILERASGLEQSILDGALTASLQVPGLQVGDEVEFGGTIVRRTPAFGNHAAGIAQLPYVGLPGLYRYRLSWPRDRQLTWKATRDLPQATVTENGGVKSLLFQLDDPSSVPDVEKAPPRFNWRRAVEFSDYANWRELSKTAWLLFDNASRLSSDSPLRTEAARIAAASSDPVERAQMALRLVQDQIRYVYVGLDGGNYVPASADDTWKRRFGDCKAKTAVLISLLDQLGISARAALVSSKGGDGTDERLPSPVHFDHVLVRANIGGQSYWLDGTRLGDRHLDLLPEPLFKWALPLTREGSDLVSVPPSPSRVPQFLSVLDIDATAGFDKPATVAAQNIVHGDDGVLMHSQLAAQAPADADRAVRAYWRQQASWIEPKQVGWRYDEAHAALVLSLSGEGKLEWEGDSQDGHSYNIPGAGFYPPDEMHRPTEQDQTADWTVEYPRFRCFATTIHLPKPTGKFRWAYTSDPMNRTLGGIEYWRTAGLEANVIRTVMSRRSLVWEISAAEAAKVNAQIPGFDNKMSQVYEANLVEPTNRKSLPFADKVDWVANPAACSPPSGKSDRK